MTRVNKYDTYKDSGIEWVGEIPTTWQKVRLRFLCNIQTGDKDTVNKVDDGMYPFYVRSPIVERINTYTFDGEAILTAGDGVGAGKVFHYVTGKFDYHQRVYNLHNFKRIFGKFLYLYLKENFYKEIEKSNAKSTVDSIRLPMLLDFPVVFPVDTVEQQVIADYLDKKCGEIDKVVETEKAVIERLKEYKQSIITEAVTKGLDKSVPLKDSGIEWIGKIPQHWKIEKLKFISECNKEVLSENTESSKTIDYIEIGSVTNENGINDHQTFTFENAPSRARRIVKHGDTIISTVRTYLKAIAYIDEQYDNYICSTGFAVFTPSSKILPKFLFHALHSEWFVSTVEANSVGISYPAINTTNIVNYKIAIPSVKEQEQILKYLDKKCSEIDKAITGKEQLIEKLTEYKKSLIYECVTGKRKVAD